MERLGDLRQCIERWIKKNRADAKPLYEFVVPPAAVIVRETNEAGEAYLEVTYPDGAHCIVWHLESTGYFLFLQGEKTADGAFFVCQTDGRVDLHVIECKRTVNISRWCEAKLQLQDSLSKVLAINGVLGIQIGEVHLGIAFREDRIDPANSPNPRVMAKPIDGHNEQKRTSSSHIENTLEWRTGQVKLRGFAKPFPLAKIQLDPNTGRGSYSLPNP